MDNTREKLNELIDIIQFIVEVDTGLSKKYSDCILEKLNELKGE